MIESLTKIDQKRFNMCIETGRRFWTMCKILRLHADVNFVYRSRDMTSPASMDVYSVINMSENCENRLIKYRKLRDGEFIELFDCYDGQFYVNPIKFKTERKFRSYYRYLFENINNDEFVEDLFHAVKKQVPVEFNLTRIKTVNKFTGKFLKNGIRYPLLYILYNSDEFVNFCRNFTADMMHTPLYHVFLIRGGYSKSDTTSTYATRNSCRKIFKNAEFMLGMDHRKSFQSFHITDSSFEIEI